MAHIELNENLNEVLNPPLGNRTSGVAWVVLFTQDAHQTSFPGSALVYNLSRRHCRGTTSQLQGSAKTMAFEGKETTYLIIPKMKRPF